MKNIKDRINSQLFKAQEVELSAEKVELSSVKEIDKFLKGARKDMENLEKEAEKLDAAFEKYYDLQREYNKRVDLTEAGFGLVRDSIGKFEQKVKELGLDPKTQPIIKGALSEVKSFGAKMRPLKQKVKKV